MQSIVDKITVINVTELFKHMRDELGMPETHIGREFGINSTEVKRIRTSDKPVYLIDGALYVTKERHKDATKTLFDASKLHKYLFT